LNCHLCAHTGGELLWQGELCRVVYVEEPGYPGFCRVVWETHVREMTDLSEDDRLRLMEVVFAVEAVLREQLAPLKMNLASFGNAVPHLHWHVIPRYADDPHFPEPAWGQPLRPPNPARDHPSTTALAGALKAALE
jgi:diadenosine tetraphosphate (Ap4A) HIT family hydrolase